MNTSAARSTTLAVPWALTPDDTPIQPEDHVAGTLVRCPGCLKELRVRGGPSTRVRLHFAHPPDSFCSPETILHKAAKRQIKLTLERWLSGEGPRVQVQSVCLERRCGRSFLYPFKPPADQVTEEHRLPSGRVADVAVLRDGVAIAIVEIFATHAVDDQKALDLGGLPCAELSAEAALRSPLLWDPNPKRRKHLRCPDCARTQKLFDQANLPPWITELWGDENRNAVPRRVGQELFVDMLWRSPEDDTQRNEFSVRVARLSQGVTRADWERLVSDRRRWVEKQAARFPNLPDFVRVYWSIEAALEVHKGAWVKAPRAPWTGRRDQPTPVPADESRWAGLRRVAALTDQPLPEGDQSPYWAEVARCYQPRCKEELILYTWRGHTWMTETPPPEPRPSSLQLRFSKQAEGDYWANTCPSCGALQGENYVYEPEGPLPERFAGHPNRRLF
ncbi:MAG: hypothetical protein IPN01_20540 [Deltaproteobacteria bacterium]|nr:hypothetical protein [Deltaproteobacteria bacterium]